MEAEDGEKSAEKASAAEERPATGPETSIAQRSHAEAIALKPSAHSSSQTASGTNAAPTRGQSPPHRIVQSPPSRSSDQTVVAGPIGSTWKSAAAKPASTGPARRVAESAHDATAIPVVVGPTALNPTLPVAASQAASSMPPLPASSFEEVSRSRPVSKGPEFSSRVQSEWLEGAPSAAMPDAVAASIRGREETAGGATQPSTRDFAVRLPGARRSTRGSCRFVLRLSFCGQPRRRSGRAGTRGLPGGHLRAGCGPFV